MNNDHITPPEANDFKKEKKRVSFRNPEITAIPGFNQVEPTSAQDVKSEDKMPERTTEEKADPSSEEETDTEKNVRKAFETTNAIDIMWKKFQEDFDNAIGGIVGAIGNSMGSPTLQKEDPESVNEQDRFEVLNGKPTLKQIALGLKAGRYKNVIVMTGAGMSTAAGIPDFRSPDKGLYATLKVTFPELNKPEEIFDLAYFKENPKPFWKLCKELNLCGGANTKYKPTKAHYLSLLLSKKKILRRAYTQNIDGLDLMTGLSPDLLVEAHGGGRTASCVECEAVQDVKRVRKVLLGKGIPKCTKCSGLCKPDITFFGEALPKRFAEMKEDDFCECDLLIVMGTSLQVAPFCNLVADVGRSIPRLLINLTEVRDELFLFKHEKNYRDVFVKDTCDAGVQRLVNLCGWKSDFQKLVKSGGRNSKLSNSKIKTSPSRRRKKKAP